MKLRCNILASHQTSDERTVLVIRARRPRAMVTSGEEMNGSMSAVICSPIIASELIFCCVRLACLRTTNLRRAKTTGEAGPQACAEAKTRLAPAHRMERGTNPGTA